jgi:acetyl esterase/lipase
MASWQAHALDAVLRITVKRKLKGNTSLESVRAALGGNALPGPKDVFYRTDIVGGVPGEWVTAPESPAGAPLLLYLHGGGYFACSPLSHRPITGWFAKAGYTVFVPDYRLAPEHPFPAAVTDAAAAYQALRDAGHAAGRMVVAGDSAGGGLALALLLTLRDAGVALPAAAALFSPWTDLAGTGASMRENEKNDAMFWADGMPNGAAFYLAGAEADTPLASPLYAELEGLPPLLIHAGERELLRDDSTRLAAKAKAAGVRVELQIWPVVPHVWQLLPGFVPEAQKSLKMADRFLKGAIQGAEPPVVEAVMANVG